MERLTDEGWGKEILSHREEYVESIISVKGGNAMRPLTEKGMNTVWIQFGICEFLSEWMKMKARILVAMRTRKQAIDENALKTRWWSRVFRIRRAVEEYQRTLHPHDFSPSGVDVCRLPDIRKVILYGTDEEFNSCAEEVASGLPKLTSKFLEERTTKISAILPFDKRPDNILSLATAWFNCGKCPSLLIHGTDALKHECPYVWRVPTERQITEVTFDTNILHGGWCAERSKFKFSEITSTIARRLILDCGEDPESITLTEINSKLHRFAFSKISVILPCSWREAVGSS